MDNFLLHVYMSKIKTSCCSYLDEKIKSLGISSSEGKYLGLITEKGPISQNDISKIVGCDKAYTSRKVTSLENKGLIRQVSSDVDARKKLFEITEKGKEFNAKVQESLKYFFSNVIFEGISESDRKLLADTLRRMSENGTSYLEKEKKNGKDA